MLVDRPGLHVTVPKGYLFPSRLFIEAVSLSRKGSLRSKPWLMRLLAAFLLGFGAAYYGTLAYPDLVPAKLLLGGASTPYLALMNGTVYGLAGMLVVSIVYRGGQR